MPQLSLHTPIGDVTISAEHDRIVALDSGWGRDQTSTALLRRCVECLHAYFDGQEVDFADLPIDTGGTAYRERVWAALRAIPAGQVRSYNEVTRVAGGCARAVGQANAHNPVPILIPCHRVVAGAGLGGYSGFDGLATKRQLLALEGVDTTRWPA